MSQTLWSLRPALLLSQFDFIDFEGHWNGHLITKLVCSHFAMSWFKYHCLKPQVEIYYFLCLTTPCPAHNFLGFIYAHISSQLLYRTLFLISSATKNLTKIQVFLKKLSLSSTQVKMYCIGSSMKAESSACQWSRAVWIW